MFQSLMIHVINYFLNKFTFFFYSTFMLCYKYTSLNTVTKSSNSRIKLFIATSRLEEFSNRLLVLKNDILTLKSSTWRGKVCFKDSEISLFVLLPRNIVVPSKNVLFVLVLLSQFKVTERNQFSFLHLESLLRWAQGL